MESPRNLLHGLLGYINEHTKKVEPSGFRLTGSSFLRRREAVTGLPGVDFDIKVAGDHTWMRVERLESVPPPRLPEHRKGLIQVSASPSGTAPTINDAVLKAHILERYKTEPASAQMLATTRLREELEAFLETYSRQWQNWAEVEKGRRDTIALYGDLFALKRQIEAEETAKPQELVWGIGLTSWRIPNGEQPVVLEYPLLTQAVEIVLDEQSMALEIRPRSTDPRIEMDAFAYCSVAGAADVEVTAKELMQRNRERLITPFEPASYGPILKLAARNLDSNGQYREIQATELSLPAPGPELVVTDDWALLARPRSNNYLLEDLRRLQQKLEQGADIPAGPLSLVMPPSDEPAPYHTINFRGLSSRGSSSGQGKPQELYFPLPYNDEQVTIVQRLEHSPGVAVQGPPGTGKTHTIANIICHYLATGRRVLVTSRGEPALQVLQSKIPEEVRQLTVALLASDREGVRQFQTSIEAIQHRVSQLNPEQTRQDIAQLQDAIDRAHRELTNIDKRVDEIAQTQLEELNIDGRPFRALNMADMVLHGKDAYGWFDDEISLKAEHAAPLSEEEGGLLREARRRLMSDIAYVDANVPSPNVLPPTSDIASMHDTLARMRTIQEKVSRGELLDLKASTPEVLDLAGKMLKAIDEAKAIVEELDVAGEEWAFVLRERCRAERFSSERQALEALFQDIDALIEARAEFLKRPVDFPERGLTCLKTKEAISRAIESGKPFGFIAFGANDAKENVAAIRVSGLPPTTMDDWAHINSYLALHNQVQSFLTRWNRCAFELGMPELSGGVANLRAIEQTAISAKKAHRLATYFDKGLPALAQQVFTSPPLKDLVGRLPELNRVREHLDLHLTKALLARASIQLSSLQEKLAGKTGPVSEAFWAFILGELGSPELEPEFIAARYTELVTELHRVAGLGSDLSLVRDYSQRIENAGAPLLATRIRKVPVAQSGEDGTFPSSWREAWTWARLRSHLETIEARKELIRLFSRRRDLENGLARLYRDMVAKSAWLETKMNATPKVLQALAGYATAIRRIGQGTGPNATRYRRDARESMLDAAGSVPCWIMSHARISEAMPAEVGAFDLVIVDEASQSDLWALPAILRGKKILVVGDDKQVSPDGGFISSGRIDELKARFLSEQPYRNEMTPEKSLYDLASRVFAAQQVMLREHFRCVPAIIAYSDRMFYKGIQPLRIPKASERIDPPLVDIYVPEGVRDRRDCNELEARAIANEITAILANPELNGRTLGVVSLLGMEQAKRIDTIVRQRCNPAELLRRHFDCGDARTFQGSERDIMFLSMVVDNQNCKALSGNMFDQRFNVAASRARDRMYLVRSVKVSDLSDRDLRLSLLAHFDKPLVGDTRDVEDLIDLCDSGFEREVFLKLVERGYRVTPQVKMGRYRIDMVVEGAADTRLAIELDGDEYHGPDRWQHDMARQRVLERAGWVFWRCFASTWSLRKDEIFEELTSHLSAMGIEPLGALDRVPSLVEKRTYSQEDARDYDDETADPLDKIIEAAIAKGIATP